MELKTIRKNSKDVLAFNKRGFIWDSWDWRSPTYRFKYLGRKGNNFKFEVVCESPASHMDALETVCYSGTESHSTIRSVHIPQYRIDAAKNYEDLMRNKNGTELIACIRSGWKIK